MAGPHEGTPARAAETPPPPPVAHTLEPDAGSNAGHLSFFTKVCYGIGGVPNQVASSAIAFYLQLFLLDVAQVSLGSSPGILYFHFPWCLVLSLRLYPHHP